LRICIWDPGSGAFYSRDKGCGTEEKSEYGIRDENPESFFQELIRKSLGLKILKFFDEDSDPGSGIYLTLDPGWKNSDPDPHLWLQHTVTDYEKVSTEVQQWQLFQGK
jgi:hypothetical protein